MLKVDLRSDTVTLPTEKMRLAMASAAVGDDVYAEDPTVNLLEQTIAKACNMQAAVFTASGTMGNQTALMSYLSMGDEVICEEKAHIFNSEVGGIAALSGAQARTITGDRGILTKELIKPYIRSTKDIHQLRTKVVCLENTHNSAGGTCYTLEQLKDIYELSREHKFAVHMDGARIMNAVVAKKQNLSDIAKYVDSISICLSKGLCAPVGAVVVGKEDFIIKVRRMRKRLGGGMRQAGILAAAGLIAFNEMVDRLAQDHQRAKTLAKACQEIGFKVDSDKVETNIIIMEDPNADKVVAKLREHNVLAKTFGLNKVRFVTHNEINDQAIAYTIEKLKLIKQSL